jgi:hypothetical protein
MLDLVAELRQLLPFKETTDIGDVVIIAAKSPQMLAYAYVSDIERDRSRKDEWWHIHLTLLGIPLQQITWTLRRAQMTGQEIFTMGGEERFVQAVECRLRSPASPAEETPAKSGGAGLKRVK